MSNITLTSSMRSNLSILRSIGVQMDKTQERLSSGLKVNSAIDNASSFYQARSLTNRAADLDSLLDAMGQGIQTIQAAIEGLETGASFLEQATVVATQTLADCADTEKTTAYYVAQGYTAITSNMDATDIKTLLDSGVNKLVLDGEISLTKELIITQQDIVIEGNGNKITFSGTKDSTVEAAIKVNGGSVDIKNLYMDISGENNYGIQAINKGVVTIDNTDGITTKDNAKKIATSIEPDLYDGKNNTDIIKALDNFNEYEAFVAATSHSVSNNEGKVIDSGDWYLGAAGEFQQTYLNRSDINTALANAGGTPLTIGVHWVSSESTLTSSALVFNTDIHYLSKASEYSVRAFKLLEGFVKTGDGANAPKVSDIMYKNAEGDFVWTDKNGTAPADYTAIGVVTNVSATGDVTIMSLKYMEDPTPETSSDASNTTMKWGPTTNTELSEHNRDYSRAVVAKENIGTITSSFTAFTNTNPKAIEGSEQFKKIINQYDNLVNDASYQGVNLLKGGKLCVTFNETRSNKFTVQGKDASANGLGLTLLDWEKMNDVVTAVKEIASALSQIRSISSELGNSYSIIQTRENFTDGLIDILEMGSDKLVLADMNEESANYLALQTCQQLAVNSLSLAAQSAQSVLSLF